jgi:hypothetical protein
MITLLKLGSFKSPEAVLVACNAALHNHCSPLQGCWVILWLTIGRRPPMTETVNTETQASNNSVLSDLPKAQQSSETPNWTMSYERLSGFLQS